MMPWWTWLILAGGVTSPVWVVALGWAYATIVYGRGTWTSWMIEEERGEFGPDVPRWTRCRLRAQVRDSL